MTTTILEVPGHTEVSFTTFVFLVFHSKFNASLEKWQLNTAALIFFSRRI